MLGILVGAVGTAGLLLRRHLLTDRRLGSTLADLSPTGLFWADADGRVQWRNDACRALVGTDPHWQSWFEPGALHGLTVDDHVERVLEVTGPTGGRRTVRLGLDPSGDGVAGSLVDLTEVAVLQDTLARRESDYEMLAVHASDIVVRTDLTGLVTHASPALYRLLGHGTAGVVGSNLTAIVHPEDRSGIGAAVEQVVATGAPRAITARLITSEGREAWVDVTVQPRSSRRGNEILELDVSMRDVTDRRFVEEEVVRNERLLETVTESSPVGIFALTGSNWTFANKRLAEISGLSHRDLLDGRLWEFVHPEDRLQLEVDRSSWTAQEVEASHGFVGGYYRLVRPDDEERWIHLRMAPVAGSDGRGWVGTVEDTTNEVTARQHTTLLATVVAGTTDLVAILNPDGSVRFINPAGREMMGSSRTADLVTLHAGRLFGPSGWKRLCEVALPVATARGSWSGDAEIVTSEGATRPVSLVVIAHRDAVGRIDRLSMLARDTSSQKAVERRLARAASHDQLTGLPNRAHFNEALTRAMATASHSESSVAVLFCDLDRFKGVNDTYGHAAGDQLLREVAIRLGGILRSGDVAARVGGDEFLVLASDVEDPSAALLLAERIRGVLDAPIMVEGNERQEVRLSFSIGVATSRPEDSPTELISRADEAMYRAKDLGKNRVQMYDARDRRSSPATLVAEQALRVAIETGQLRLRYQPVLDLVTGRTIGCEALVRWAHPELGVLSPRDFIDLAEDTGLIRPLGSWVLAEAIRQAGEWHADTTMPPHLSVSINLSAQQLVDGDLAERTAAMMKAMRLPADSLFVELTERALATDEAVARAELNAFRELGVRVAVDDFGTGYSSLAQLRRFPVDVLKLDAAFVRGLGTNPADDAIVATVQGLADALALRTVAEGVETVDQLDALRGLGCRLGQGYLFSEPLTPTAFAAFARRGPVELVSSRPGPAELDVDGSGDLAEDRRTSREHPLHQ